MTPDEDLAHDLVLAEVRKIYSADRKKYEREQNENVKCIRSERDSKKSNRTGRGMKPKQNLQPLVEPLEKPKAKRLQREAGFEHVAIEVNKWTDIVEERRKADQLHFPMEKVDLRVLTSERNYKPTNMNDLEKEVYGLLYGAELDTQEKETEKEKTLKNAMSLKEIRERSSKIMKDRNLRMRLERKSALLNKSKSRKYHKILRRERLMRKKQEFEKLMETDPKAALQMLYEMEKTRIKERMTLRHKKSRWLRLQQARAPHDGQVRDLLKENKEMSEVLLERLRIQKLYNEAENSDLDEDDDNEENLKLMNIMKDQAQAIKEGKFDSENAWVSHLAVPNSAADSEPDLSFYKMKQYWEDRNKEKLRELEALKVVKEYEKKQNEAEGDEEKQEPIEEEEEEEEDDEKEENIDKNCDNKMKLIKIEMNENTIQIKKEKKSKLKISKNKKVENKKQKTTKKIKKGKNKNTKEDKEKTTEHKTKNIITDTDKQTTNTSMSIKNKSIENKTKVERNNNSKEDFNKDQMKSDENVKKNEGIKATSEVGVRIKKSNQPQMFKKIEERKMGGMKHDRGYLKQLKRLNDDESDSEEDEGFEDILFSDDYVKEFKEEKKSHEESMKLKDIDTFKPGWGSWGGPGIVHSENRKKKFRIKAPKAQPNKYSNIGNVIYNEKADMHENVRKHMVSELPFPFTSVKDFEASIRQPIGRTFVPELIHKKLIAPSVVTKMGAVIEPMNEDCLIKHHKNNKRQESALEKELDEKLRNARGNKKRKTDKESDENKKRKSNKKKKKNRSKAKPLIFL